MHRFKDFLFLLVGALALVGFLVYQNPNHSDHHTKALIAEQAFGTPARSEREYKVSMNDANLKAHQVETWAHEMKNVLREKIKDVDYWATPGLVGSNYFVEEDVKTYLYRDIYFDTPDELCKQYNVSYRLRNRFKSLNEHDGYVRSPQDQNFWPYRAEFQAKFDRKEEANGFSSVMEARFEFREESDPFSKTNPPPGPPWPLDEYIPYFQSGRFAGMVTYPAQDIMRYFQDKTDKEELQFSPVLVFVTERTRQHLHIKTPWGYGPNPTQAYIISFDNVTVYAADDYLARIGTQNGIADLSPVGKLVELEVEFERNVSQNLDKEIKAQQSTGNTAEVERLSTIRDGFLSDQRTLIQTLAGYLKSAHRLVLEPQKQSKFGQSKQFDE